MALNQLLHPANQLLPQVVKQQVKDSLTAAPVRGNGRKTARPASRLRTVLLTLIVPGRNRKISLTSVIMTLSRWVLLESSAEMTHKSPLSKARYSSIRPSTSITVGFSWPEPLQLPAHVSNSAKDGLLSSALLPCTFNLLPNTGAHQVKGLLQSHTETYYILPWLKVNKPQSVYVCCLLWATSIFIRDLHATSCAFRLANRRATLPSSAKPLEALVARTHQLRPHNPELQTVNQS